MIFSKSSLIGFSISKAGAFDDFFKAIEFDEPVAVQQLLLRGFVPNTPTADLQTPLILAIQKGSCRVSQVLLSSPQLQVNRPNPSDETPLMLAALKQQQMTDQIKRVSFVGDKMPIYLACSPQKESSKKYVQLWDEGIKALRASGEATAILARYGIFPSDN